MTDVITIIRARRGKRLAKPVRADGTIGGYDNPFRYDLIEQATPDLGRLGELLAGSYCDRIAQSFGAWQSIPAA